MELSMAVIYLIPGIGLMIFLYGLFYLSNKLHKWQLRNRKITQQGYDEFVLMRSQVQKYAPYIFILNLVIVVLLYFFE